MRLFLAQLGWEFYKLAARPRTWFAFVAVLVFELLASSLLRVGSVRIRIARDFWKMRWQFDETFSGLTTAAHMLGEAATVLGGLGIALVAADMVAKESEEGTLRAILGRPISRSRLLWQKLFVCTAYAVALTLFTGASALVIGMLFEGRGPLLMFAPHEEVIGTFDFVAGLERYGLAVALLAFTQFSGMVVPFALSCFDIRPAAAAVLALSMLLADTSLRVAPELASIRPWCMTTRLLSWRQVFNDEIPWTRITRNYTILASWDAAWIALGFITLRRRDITR